MSKVVKIKTQQTTANVEDFVNKVENEQQRADSFTIIEMMKTISVTETMRNIENVRLPIKTLGNVGTLWKMMITSLLPRNQRLLEQPATPDVQNCYRRFYPTAFSDISRDLQQRRCRHLTKFHPYLRKCGSHLW